MEVRIAFLLLRTGTILRQCGSKGKDCRVVLGSVRRENNNFCLPETDSLVVHRFSKLGGGAAGRYFPLPAIVGCNGFEFPCLWRIRRGAYGARRDTFRSKAAMRTACRAALPHQKRRPARAALRLKVCNYYSCMLHKLPPTPAFLDARPDDPIQEIALRVVVELPEWEMYVVGTATLIAGHLAITAKHVVEAAIRRFGARRSQKGIEVEGHSLRLYQVLPGPIYNIWNVSRAWICATDIAILHLNLDSTSAPGASINWRAPSLRVTPPPSGQTVLAFGYRESKVQISERPGSAHHIDLNDIGTTSVGAVGQIFPERRDSSMLTFPCFEVRARFAPGMSGGLVVDEFGALCGLVCASLDLGDPAATPLSYAATLWPMLTTLISADRGDAYPRGVEYPVIDLALDNIIHAVGLEGLDPSLFPGRTLPRSGS